MLDWMRSRGTTRWMPFDARTWNCAALADHRLGLVGPDAGGVDDLPGPDLELGVGLEVAHPHAGDPLALAQEPDRPARGWRRARRRRRGGARRPPSCAGRRRPGRRSTGSRRRARPCAATARAAGAPRRRQVPVAGQAAGVAGRDGHRVVERHPGPGVEPLPAAVLERVEERHRAHQVRRQPLGEQAALAQRLAHQARSRASPGSAGRRAPACWTGCDVPAAQSRPSNSATDEAAGHRVQRDAGADDAAADDHDVELVERGRVEGCLTLGRLRAGSSPGTARVAESGSFGSSLPSGGPS